MANETGSQYIARCRQLGFSDQEITAAMQKAGWETTDLQQAFAEAQNGTASNSSNPKKAGKKIPTLLWVLIAVIVIIFLLVGGVIGYLAFFTDTFAQDPAATDFTYKAVSIIIG